MLKRRFFLIEHLIILYQILNFYYNLQDYTKLNILLTLLTIKYFVEGFRLTTFAFLLIEGIKYALNDHQYWRVASILITCYLVYGFPSYYPLDTTGKYQVGYRNHKIDKANLAIFYPIDKSQDQEIENITFDYENKSHWRRIYEIMQYEVAFFPSIIFRVAFNFMEKFKLNVNKHTKITQNEQKFNVLIFAGGLSSNKHMYTILHKELASQGVIVIAFDINMQTYANSQNHKLIEQHLRVISETNISQIKQIVESVNDPKGLLHNLISSYQYQQVNEEYGSQNQNNISYDAQIEHKNLKVDKIILAGHSFGGGSVVEYARREPKLVSSLLLFDPWMLLCESQTLEAKLDIPIFINLSRNYIIKGTESMKIRKFYNNNSVTAINLRNFTAQHNSIVDLVSQTPQEMIFFDVLKEKDTLSLLYRFYRVISMEWINIISSMNYYFAKNVAQRIFDSITSSFTEKEIEKLKLDLTAQNFQRQTYLVNPLLEMK